MSQAVLRALYQQPKSLVREAYAYSIESTAKDFIESTTLLFISSINESGNPDISPRGGAAGFIKILDAKHIAFLDSPGNNKVLTFTNLADSPQVGLLFMVPGRGEILRGYGRAVVSQEETLFESLGERNSKRNKTAVQIEITKLFPHCGNALKSASLWKSESWVSNTDDRVPTLMDMARGMAAFRNENT
ncbi:MAG: pyridoxamine 5'-phosphate oxidase family protein [Pseudomonadales bacterium]